MGLYWKTAAGVLLAVLLTLMLRRQEMGMVLSLAVCAMAACAALAYLEPVMALLESLETLGELDGQMVGILLKAVGIGMVTEIACMVCADSGNSAMGKALQLLGTAAILWLSLPLFKALLELIQEMLEKL